MNSLRVLITTALLTGLAGCATTTPAERAAQMQRQADEMVQIYGPACDKLGYTRDSNPWRDCVLNLATQENMKLYSRMYNYPVGGPYFGYHRYHPW